MSEAHDYQRAIRSVISEYKRLFREEYDLVCDAVKMQRQLLADKKFGEVSDGTRALYETSETLQALLVQNLSVEGLMWFKSLEGGRWFANTFKEFALPTHI